MTKEQIQDLELKSQFLSPRTIKRARMIKNEVIQDIRSKMITGYTDAVDAFLRKMGYTRDSHAYLQGAFDRDLNEIHLWWEIQK